MNLRIFKKWMRVKPHSNSNVGVVRYKYSYHHRYNYTEDAYRQLLLFQPKLPMLTYLIQCKQKWGVDFCLQVRFLTLEECTAYKENIEKFVLATYWKDAAKRLKQRRTIGLLKSDLHRTIGKPDFLVSLKQN
jgi:hypothetical protein